MAGGTGNNTFHFGKGDGQDLIQYSYDTTAGKLSTLVLKAGVAPSEVQVRQVYDSTFGSATGALEVTIAGTTDKVTINGFFYGDDPANAYNGVQQIKFTDGGVIWNWATLKAKLYAGSAGNDTVRGSAAADTLNGLAGNDSLNGAGGNDIVNGGDGNDTLQGEAGDDLVDGGLGDDLIQGGDGIDNLKGAGGNDNLDGGLGNDVLEGGLGNDTVAGGTGNNTFHFGKGDGQDLIQYSYDTTAGKLSTLVLKAGVAPSEVQVRQVYDSTFGSATGALEVTIAGTTDKVTINGFFYGDDPANAYNGVQQIKFTDGGVIWNWATLKAKLYAGSAGNDTVRGSAAADTLNGLAGNDSLNGAGGNDIVNGGDGNDTLQGEAGDDLVDGGLGDDLIQGGDGIDNLKGAGGNDNLDGGLGNDVLEGGLGNDTVAGGTGNNTFHFGKGDGQDLIQYSYDTTAGKLSTLVLKAGVAPSEVQVRQVYDSTFGSATGALEVTIAGTTDKVTINGFFYGDDPANAYNGVQQIKFTDGGVIWNWATLKAKLYAGSAGNDTVRGSAAADTLNGLAGNDSLNGAGGNDIVNGGDGNDTLQGEAGDDLVDGGLGDDLIQGGDGIDNLKGAGGNDNLDGGLGNDVLEGGLGNDTVAGGTGNNTFHFGKGDGQDLIQYSYDTTAGKLSTLVLKAGVAPSEVQVRQVYDSTFGSATGALEVTIAGTTDKVTINGFFYGDDPANAYNGVQQIKFTDGGVIWNWATLKAKLYAGSAGNDTVRGSAAADTLNGLAGNDSLNGAGGNDIVNGGDGNDTLQGEAGDDLVDGGLGDDLIQGGDGIDNLKGAGGNDNLDGGLGNDVLEGGLGNDTVAGGTGNNTFHFGKGDGQDLIQYSYDTTAGKLSTLVLKAGVAPSEVQLRKVYDTAFGNATGALEIAIAGTTDKVVVNGFFYGNNPVNSYNGVQQIQFSGGIRPGSRDHRCEGFGRIIRGGTGGPGCFRRGLESAKAASRGRRDGRVRQP